MDTIAITGASGFIGGRAAQRLQERGYHVVALGRGKAPKSLGEAEYRQVAFDQAASLSAALENVHGILHCAGKAGAWGAYADYYDANVALSERLADAALKSGVRRFVNLSSPSIYFDYCDQLALREDFIPRRFSNPYAETKYFAERAVHARQSDHFEVISLRPRGVIGAGDTNWLPRIISMREAARLIQTGDGTNLANFTSIENLLDAIELAFKAPSAATGRVYNIHNGPDEKFWDVVEQGLHSVGLDAERRVLPRGLVMSIARANALAQRLCRVTKEPDLLPVKAGVSAYSMTMDLTAAKERLGFVPRQTTQEALAQFGRWYPTFQASSPEKRAAR